MKTIRNSIFCVWVAGIGWAQGSADLGWTFQNPQRTGNTLHAVSALSAKPVSRKWGRTGTMIAVGDVGTILRTTDAGAVWTLIPSGTSAGLTGVSFADANTGIAVGSQGVILRTTDGGATWTPQVNPLLSPLNAVTFSDALVGNAVGQSGAILRTTDGG